MFPICLYLKLYKKTIDFFYTEPNNFVASLKTAGAWNYN